MECSHCGKLAKNLNSLRQHEIRCKLNPNKIKVIGMKGEKNPNWGKKGNNHFTVAVKNGLEKPLISEETRSKMGNANRNKVWTQEEKNKHSIAMSNAVKNHPLSYSANNVCGRTKRMEYNGTNLTGSWELLFAKWLDLNSIKWTNKIKGGFEYEWNNSIHMYYPDFYLTELDLYVEVKGYERERDKHKWSRVKNLKVFKKKEIDKIKRILDENLLSENEVLLKTLY